MKTFNVRQNHHYGWTENQRSARTALDAIIADVQHYHKFLEDYRLGVDYEVIHVKPGDYSRTPDYEGYRVDWINDIPKEMALDRRLNKGSYWFGDAIKIEVIK